MKSLLLLLLIILSFSTPRIGAAYTLEDLLDRKAVQNKIKEKIADQDINFDVDLANIELAEGIKLSNSYTYDVEASYVSQHYTRIDKWDVGTGIDVGDVLKEFVDIPFSFSIDRKNSFFFVRQFPNKTEAIKASPYNPSKLPLNADLALNNLQVGDFVSIPANLSIAAGVGFSTTMISPVVVAANAGTSFVISGEFTIQVFKIDETHVRLKMITRRGKSTSASGAIGLDFKLFGIKLLDRQINRLFERDFAQFGVNYNPGAQFIIDYVFDLSSPEAKDAYNKVMSSTLKFKDLVVADMVDPSDLKDKLISSYERADALFDADIKLEPKDRRVQRIFKGFSSYSGHTQHMKFSLLIASYANDRTLSDAKVTFIDKKEDGLAFYYPTYSKFTETHFGRKRFFDLKDQIYQNNFGLIPQFRTEDPKTKNPDIGVTFERKDRYFTSNEQKTVEEFMLSEIPDLLTKDMDLSQWKDGTKKYDSRIFFQLIFKSQGFEYLKNLDVEDLKKKILSYVEEKRRKDIIVPTKENLHFQNIKNFFMVNRYIQKTRLISLAKSLATILKNPSGDGQEMLKKLVGLNEFGVFDKIGVGFLISLLPQDKLEDLVYLKLEMIGKDLKPLSLEKGTLNYRALYKELNEVQSRLSNRSYDMRLSEDDRNMEDLDIDNL